MGLKLEGQFSFTGWWSSNLGSPVSKPNDVCSSTGCLSLTQTSHKRIACLSDPSASGRAGMNSWATNPL